MNAMEITKELKNDIEVNQVQLQNAICNHQRLVAKAKEFPEEGDSEQIQEEIKEALEKIVQIGVEQKHFLERLRQEYRTYQRNLKTNIVNGSLDERRFSLSAALNRARKQNFQAAHRLPAATSPSKELDGYRITPPQSPPAENCPTDPHDVEEPVFLRNFGLVTHEVFSEMQKKKAERKRRSTANPHFVYGNRGSDYVGPPMKKKKRRFLARPPSPPNTRGRKRQEMAILGSTKAPSCSSDKSTNNGNWGSRASFKPILPYPAIPNLPSGLVIERVNSGSSSPDPSQCVVCKQPDSLSICAQCSNGFHMGCHNRPFARTPKECPKCLSKSDGRRSAGSSSSSSSSGMSYPSPYEISEKLNLKQELEEKHKDLLAEVTQLQNRHSELTISLKEQEAAREKLKLSNGETETKITQLISFIKTIKRGPVPDALKVTS